MARVITCDICGAQIAHNNMDSYLDLPDEASTLRIKSVACNPDLTYEMCPHCTQRVIDFVKNLTKESRFEFGNVSQTTSH